ncbi:hypothetical protein [Sphingobium aquiterrae]|uniref:hypothetical protein n=1 Tax=Sphingobium aquiterrae TaxID=2038656 RepID=UPI0030195321
MRATTAILLSAAAWTFSLAPAMAQSWNTRWSPENVEKSIWGGCKIPPSYLSISMETDGRAWVQQSPSLTAEQTACVADLLKQYNIELRNAK